jgi:murein DD-endopeptidase MepM/ murein hydrolase activator NlpD
MKTVITLIVLSFSLFAASLSGNGSGTTGDIFINPLHPDAEITAAFGPREHPVLKQTRNHTGMDFKVAVGDHVHASAPGTIIFMGSNEGYGNLVEIEHAGDIITRYAHLSEFYEGLTEGSEVESGQLIAYAGQSGMVTGPVLHFELLVDGVSHNPAAFFK